MNRVKVKRLHPSARVPVKSTDGSGCHDVFAVEEVQLSGIPTLVRTGLAMEIPVGYILDIRPRSGMSRNGIKLDNSPGTIDPDYRGEIGILLTDTMHRSGVGRVIKVGAKIAQVKLERVPPVVFEEVAELSQTKRGASGFGSTGE